MHTPGPWHAAEHRTDDGRYYIGVGCEEASWVAKLSENTKRSLETDRANVYLLAAAPDLFSALCGLIEIGKRDLSNPKYDEYFESAKVAIAKARGR